MTTAKLPRVVEEKPSVPTGRKEINAAAHDYLNGLGEAVQMLKHPLKDGAPEFFMLMRKGVHIIKVIGENSFQPHEKHKDYTLAIAVAIYVLDKDADTTTAQDNWIARAKKLGIQVHIARTWGEFHYAVGLVQDI